MRRGSALIMALCLIAVLAIMVVSFSFEARQQSGINIYVRERNRVNRLVEPARMIAETVMLDYKNAKAWSEDENPKDLDEEDRFYMEKRNLCYYTKCTIGPLLLDEEDINSGTVTIDIELANSGENSININSLYKGGDQNYALRWQMILLNSGIPEDLEVEVKDSDGSGTTKRNLINHLVACWNDWRDEDDNVSAGPFDEYHPLGDDGAESAWYKEADETAEKEAHGRDEREAAKENRRRPRNGSIPDVQELATVRGFRDFPAVLTGGLLYPDEEQSEENPRLNGIILLFGTSGNSKLVINPNTTVDQLMTLPGIFPEDDDEDDREESRQLAQAILDTLKVKPEDYDVDETRDWWPYKDWSDLKSRVEDQWTGSVKLRDEASQYIEWSASDTSIFKVKIVCESMGMKREVNCECYVNTKDKKVRYVKWRED